MRLCEYMHRHFDIYCPFQYAVWKIAFKVDMLRCSSLLDWQTEYQLDYVMMSNKWECLFLKTLFFFPTDYKSSLVPANRPVLIAFSFQDKLGVHHLLIFRPLYDAPITHSVQVAYFFVHSASPRIDFISIRWFPNGQFVGCKRSWHCIFFEPF